MVDIVFVHGAWVGPKCWESWRSYFAAEGFASLAPAWPFDDRPYEALRSAPRPELAAVGVPEIVAHYAGIIDALPEPPILVGHSFGGLIVQLLLARGRGAAGVAINPAPPRGVLPTPRALVTAAPVLLAWRGWRRILSMSFRQFQRGFVHELPPRAQREAYETHVIPTPGRPYFQAAFAPFHHATALDYRADRAPLLITAGELDRTAPPAMNRANHRAYRRSASTTDFELFPGRSHWIIGEPGWEQVAGHVHRWIRGVIPAGAVREQTARPR